MENSEKYCSTNVQHDKPVKYAHLADLHLGSWRDEKMRELSTKSFLRAIDECISENVDFVIFAGDLFNTSLPSVDTLKIVTGKIKELSDKGIRLYVIAGSHDFSPSGKTMVEVLEKAGLVFNVCKGGVNPETGKLRLDFTVDEPTGVKLTGIIGRKGQLDQKYYQDLELENLEQERGYKIFVFHTTVSELLPRDMALIESQPMSVFPKNFAYYAGGHIHHPVIKEIEGHGVASYTGAMFPNNFVEIEKYSMGGYNVVTVFQGRQEVQWRPLKVVEHRMLKLDCNNKTPEVVTFEVMNHFNNQSLDNTLITLRLFGRLQSGRVSDINFKEIFAKLYEQGAYFVMKNTAKLHSEEFEEIKTSAVNPESIEEEVMQEHLQQVTLFDKDTELHLTKSLLQSLNTSKKEGETITDFQRRINSEIAKLLEIDF